MSANAPPVRAPAWNEGRIAGWLTTVDHKRIGILYIVTAFVFFLLGGVMALLMRLQLAQADLDIVTKDTYNGAVHAARDDDDLPLHRPRARRASGTTSCRS